MTSTRTAPALPATVLVAVLAGIVLGVLDLVLIRTLPYPWADLANSSAVWALAAFVLGRALRRGPLLSALAGAVLLVVAVEAYYLAAIAVDLASPARLTSPSTVAWVAFGVLAGAGFGLAGAWSRDRGTWRAAAGVALAAGVLLAEAWLRLDQAGTALLTAALAALVLATAWRHPGEGGRAAVLAAPLAVLCLVGFTVAGFGN